MADRLVDSVIRISTSPQDDAAFGHWLTAPDAVEFLQANVADEDFVFYAPPSDLHPHETCASRQRVSPATRGRSEAERLDVGEYGVVVNASRPARRKGVVAMGVR